jgi:hypothetical protein
MVLDNVIEEVPLNFWSVCRTKLPIRYAGDANDGYSTDDERQLSRDHRAVYFTSDRVIPVHFPLTPEQAQQNFKLPQSSGWFAG